jgi:hypothetical protein
MTRLRVTTIFVVATLLTVACGATTNNHHFYLGTGPDRCLDMDSDCQLAHECCSNWCVNNVCQYRP